MPSTLTQTQLSLFRLTLDTNPEDCNASCIMCEEHSEHSDFIEQLYQKTGRRRRRMPREWLADLFAQASALGVQEIIPSTMGEPLIYKHFEHILDLCHQHEIKLNLTTNGTFPRKLVEEWAELIVPVTRDVKFSWNGATKETYERVMKGIEFEQVLDQLQRFIAVRDAHQAEGGDFCRVTLQLTFMETNMHELPEMVRMAAEMGVDRIKGHHLWAHFHEIQDQDFRRDAASRTRWNSIVADTYAARDRYLRADGKPVLLENIFPLEVVTEGDSQAVPDHYACPFLGRELWVSPEGKLSPCCAPDAQRQTLADFGRVPEQTLTGMLQSESYRSLKANYKQHALCQGCSMRRPV